MPKRQRSDVRGIAKAERARDRQAKKTEKLAKRREAREQRAEPEAQAPRQNKQGRGP